MENHRGIRTLCFLLYLCATAVLSGTATAQTLDEQGWRTFPKRSQLLKDDYRGNYARDTIKNDFFIFQRRVVIDDLLVTNGGDVLIVADELVLNAPIDTRVRFRMGPDYWAPPIGNEANGADASLGYVLNFYQHPAALKAFDSLYLWRESYDPVAKRFAYQIAPRPEKRTGAAPSTTELIQLPSAQVPLASGKEFGHSYDTTRPSDGADAPDDQVIWANVRSGNIRIYASKILLCDQCKKGLIEQRAMNKLGEAYLVQQLDAKKSPFFDIKIEGPNSTKADPFDFERSVFLQSSGLKGGRGAAGSLHSATYGNLFGMPGGLSGRPGRGGDAGSIEVHFVNRIPAGVDYDLLKLGAVAEGGQPAQSHRERTSSAARLVAVQDRTAFVDEIPVPNLEKLRGKPGDILFDTIDTDSAIQEINSILIESELTENYAVDLLVAQAGSTPNLFSISPIDTLHPFLAQELTRLQQELVDQISLSVRSPVPSSIVFSPFFESVSCAVEKYSGLIKVQQQYLQKICEYKKVSSEDALRSLLYRTEGIYRNVPSDTNIKVWHQETMTELIRTEELVMGAIKAIGDLHIFVYGAITDAQKSSMLAAIDALQARRAALEEAYEAQRDKADI